MISQMSLNKQMNTKGGRVNNLDMRVKSCQFVLFDLHLLFFL